jgi:hypothetical protein
MKVEAKWSMKNEVDGEDLEPSIVEGGEVEVDAK